jgi:hypothetical protein
MEFGERHRAKPVGGRCGKPLFFRSEEQVNAHVNARGRLYGFKDGKLPRRAELCFMLVSMT